MKRVWIAAAVLAFLAAAAGLAQTPAPSAPLSAPALAAILGQSPGAACPRPQEDVVFAARRQGNFFKTCSATATCGDTSGGSVNCSYGGPGGSCSFQNQDCANGIQGFVNCQGSVTECPVCPCNDRPVCCNCYATGDCFACCRCDGGSIGFCISACGGF